MDCPPDALARLFWDVDPKALDVTRDSVHILSRILEYGRLAEVRWAIAQYGMGGIHTFLRDTGHAELSDRTIAFWRAALRAEDEPWKSPPAWRRSSSVPWID